MTIEINVHNEIKTEIAVIGAGPAGLCASIAAARLGMDTVLIERGGCAGGMATQGLVGPFMTCYNKSSDTMIIRGIFSELIDRLVEHDGAIHPSKTTAPSGHTSYIGPGHMNVTPFDPEILKYVADEMLLEAGVKILYHTDFLQATMTGNLVNGVVVHTKGGVQTISAKMVVDCTGDGDVAASCKVPFKMGDEEKKIIQPVSMIFRIGNVDYKKIEQDIEEHKDNFYRRDGVNYRSFHWQVEEARKAGDWPLDRVSIGMFQGVKPDEWTINTSRVMGIDGTESTSLTSAEVEGRRQVKIIFSFIKKYLPGCSNATLLSSASQVGIRETRHIMGEYILTADDILQGRNHEDNIFVASNSIDVHGRYGPMSNEFRVIENGEWYGIPYRCLIPKGVDGLLVAGRCISSTSEAAGAIRLMPLCMASGQAAGTAASLTVRQEVTNPRLIDYQLLKAVLIENGVFL